MLLNILLFFHLCIGVMLGISMYKYSQEKYPERSFGVDFAIALACVAYLIFWPILILWLLYTMITGKKSYDEEKEDNNQVS